MTSEKLPRSRSRSATIGLRKGPIANRMPVETNAMTENASATYQPKNTREVMPRTIAEVRARLSKRCRVLNFSSMRLIGMVHVPPLPGSPRWAGSMERVSAAALADARALVNNGMDAVLVENWGDAPFTPGRVEPATVAAMSVVAGEVRKALPRTHLGVNVLKNDARAALAVAAAVGAEFIRVNVHAGAVLADQGIVQSDAYGTLRDRRLLGADVAIFADVGGKHAVPLGPVDIDQTARDLVHRGLADALVVSGPATGQATPLSEVKRVRSAVGEVPLLIGSGVTAESAAELLSVADGLIVGTSVKRDGDVRLPVERARVEKLVAAARRR